MTRLPVAESSSEDLPTSGVLARASAWVERFGLLLACLLLLLIGVAAVAQSALKPFWWDELASYDIARLPHLSDVWSFFRAGLDTPSPVPTLIVWGTQRWIGVSEVLVRTAFEAGFLAMCLGLYGITARRYGAGFGLCAMLLPALSGTFYYASELRTYGILGVFAGLALAIVCHLFAIFVLIPFGLAQLVRDRVFSQGLRRSDGPIWLALVMAPACLIIEMPGMAAAHRTYAGAFWSKPHGGEILFSYSYALGIGWMIAVMVLLMAWHGLERRFGSLEDEAANDAGKRGFGAAEWTLFGTLALMPWFAWPLSHFVGVYVPRYVLPLTIGVVLLVIGGAAEAVRRNRVAGTVLAGVLLLVLIHDKLPEVNRARHLKQSLTQVFAGQPMVPMLAESGLPIVAPNTIVYTQLQHYLPADLEKRLTYTRNTPERIRTEEDPDAELSMKLFATRLPLRVEEFAAFTAEHPRFLVVVKNSLAEGGIADGISVRWVGSYGSGVQYGFGPFSLYEVEVVKR